MVNPPTVGEGYASAGFGITLARRECRRSVLLGCGRCDLLRDRISSRRVDVRVKAEAAYRPRATSQHVPEGYLQHSARYHSPAPATAERLEVRTRPWTLL